MTTHHDHYDETYWHAAGMDDDLQLGPPIVGVVLLTLLGCTVLTIAALVIREMVR